MLFSRQGNRPIFWPLSARKMSHSLACERLPCLVPTEIFFPLEVSTEFFELFTSLGFVLERHNFFSNKGL